MKTLHNFGMSTDLGSLHGRYLSNAMQKIFPYLGDLHKKKREIEK